MKIKFTLTAT